jgi:extracellular factor (EF) 3-hydroxypalmitic acid methyl ester biosynthesis protein
MGRWQVISSPDPDESCRFGVLIPAYVDRRIPVERNGSMFQAAMEVLDRAHALSEVSEAEAMNAAALLCGESRNWRSQLSAPDWIELVERVARPHPVTAALHEDPCSFRSFRRPRGFPGDAALLDFIYHHRDAAPCLRRATRRGRAISDFITNLAECRAARHRAQLIALEIENWLLSQDRPRFLSVACGYLRELELLPAAVFQQLTGMVGIDCDPESVDQVNARIGRQVEARKQSIKLFWNGEAEPMGHFDFIYASGIYDYLPEDVARRLTAGLYRRLKPNGKLWIANFLCGGPGAAYMEAFMDWWLIYRSKEEVLALADGLPGAEVRPFTEPQGCIQFLELTRRR